MSKLPMDVITDILYRLPVKALVRFKSLSKPCCFLIDDPDFIRDHLNRSIQTRSNLNIILKGLHLYSVEFDALDTAVPLDYPLSNGAGTEAFGSCNGLLAFRITEKNLALYNPSTRLFRRLPVSEIDPPPGESCKSGYVFYGFGQDVKTDDYKVLRMAQFNQNDDEDGEGYFYDYEVKVYSLKNDSWRKITKLPPYLRFMFQFFYHLLHRRGYGVLAGGVLHWVMPPRIELGMRNRIVGFDLGTEEFVEVPQPECANKNYLLDVGVLEGCLCAVCNYDQVSVDVWVMKEYGVKESWSRLLSVQKTRAINTLTFLKPLAYSKFSEKVLLEINNQKFAWYDLQKKKMRSVKIGGSPGTFGAEVYVGSLIPIEDQKRKENEKQNEQGVQKNRNRNKRDDFLSQGFKLVL
ncbi:F-box protein CPR30-like [Durio zibethinus]|uniref:F-box protein CPR30-like n=1 Tax=Durio zibethinus TaxID=66656 RepID=A0A6P5WJ98_DURZI|nr:F-box protein CPR30-like [Durio zibethinus]